MDKLIIFDCDGVLVDSELIANRMDAEILTSIGYPISLEDTLQRFIGMNLKTLGQVLFDETGRTFDLSSFTTQQEILLKIFEKELQPLNDSLLTQIELLGVIRCVASSSPRDRVLRSLEITNQLRFFNEESIFTSQQVKNGKPAPDLFLLAAKEMGFIPEDCIVIEDSFAGVTAALAANMQVIGFLGGSHAKFPWYEDRLRSYNIPVANNSKELQSMVNEMITINVREAF
jgi:HAD superfamily hydrolase (TIGR01509 family)